VYAACKRHSAIELASGDLHDAMSIEQPDERRYHEQKAAEREPSRM
jgi:hypothetical protein